ncbi:MAG: hypothetical protein NT009_13320 [Proteobacteria bacterium]|nr:hypothetical protein [Pseudomonadota bacterium]
MELSKSGRLARRLVKRLLYSMLSFREGILVLLGRAKPYVRFTVEDAPPSVYYNFRVRPDRRDGLERHLDLPPGFSLAKMRFLEQDPEAAYYISLNVYRVSGITNALRAEWSVFVKNAAEDPPVTRYLVAEAQSSEITMDPVNIFVRARRVEQALLDNRLETRVESFQRTYFHAIGPMPERSSLPTALVTREWLKSNDLIYWPNGIGDRVYYNGGLAGTEMLCLPPESFRIEDTTAWHEFILPVPDHVLVFQNPLEFVISPWWNV